jgi:RimJ/RimL family protein N-acetyltransferase
MSQTTITLRPIQPGDLEVFFQNQLDPEANWMAAFTSKDPTDRAAFDAHWEKITADETVFNRTILVDGLVIGSVAKYEMMGESEVTYWINRQYWGQGITTRALKAFLKEMTTRPLFGRAAADNYGSIRVLEKCGFQKIGVDQGFANARGEEIEEVIMRLD